MCSQVKCEVKLMSLFVNKDAFITSSFPWLDNKTSTDCLKRYFSYSCNSAHRVEMYK